MGKLAYKVVLFKCCVHETKGAIYVTQPKTDLLIKYPQLGV